MCNRTGANHDSGIDLVLGRDGVWYVLEDNLRIPCGASYPLIACGGIFRRIAAPGAIMS